MGFHKVVSPSELVGGNSLQDGPAHPNVASLLLVPAKLYGHGYVEEWRNMGEYPPPFHHSLEANGRKLEILQSTEQPITCISSSAPFSPSLSLLSIPSLPFPSQPHRRAEPREQSETTLLASAWSLPWLCNRSRPTEHRQLSANPGGGNRRRS